VDQLEPAVASDGRVEAHRGVEVGWQVRGPARAAHIWKPRRGRYDPNNLWPTVKAVVDGFVDAGLLADDDHLHVIGPDMRHGGVGPAALVLEIVPVNTPQHG
jgi:hypothetical protein